MERNYQDMEKLVFKVSVRSSYCQTCYTEDAYNAGMLGYTKACRDFDPSRGNCFSTVVWHYVKNEVHKHCRGCSKWMMRNQPVSEGYILDDSHGSVWDHFRDVSEDAQEVIRLIRLAPEEFMTVNNQDSRAALRTYLVRLGWPVKRIKTTFDEIREVLG